MLYNGALQCDVFCYSYQPLPEAKVNYSLIHNNYVRFSRENHKYDHFEGTFSVLRLI